MNKLSKFALKKKKKFPHEQNSQEVMHIVVIPAFWHYIKEHLNRQDLQRYSLLKTITTEEGRGRAWLRAALNEHSVEKYMHMIIEDQTLLRCGITSFFIGMIFAFRHFHI